ncbi:MAG: GTP 3',8-cyclase MoaA [Bacteroidota bacterium]
MLIDNHGRRINYLRLAVTDRCNLRCNYCMPAEGINFAKKEQLLSTDELKMVSEWLVSWGITKIRLTGGEPFVRKDLMELIRHLSALPGLEDISVTTNATLIGPHIAELKTLGIRNVNVSLDAVNESTFKRITRRDTYEIVMENLHRLIDEGFNVRINFIVLDGQNEQEVLPILARMKDHKVAVRFLEEMPFNGGSRSFGTIQWDYKKILAHIIAHYPRYQKLESPPTATAINYQIEGHQSTFGIIPSFSRTFCGSCNRLRVTAKGDVITCLYGKPKANIKKLMADHNAKLQVKEALLGAIGTRAKTGFEAQNEHANQVFENSMTSIGG